MPIQIQDIGHENESSECPLCMEPLEVDDINFFPCTCGYQICRFCWHRIRTDENGLCPACRTSYPEDPAEFKPLTGSDLQKIRHEKRQKEVQRRQKLTDGRRHLASIRVLQKNLVFVVGLSHRLSDPEILKRQEYFGKYGKILKVVINSNTAYAGTQGPSSSAYVTYSKMEESLQAIQSVNNVYIDGRTLKASLGTTKYCSTYLKNQQCHKVDCMYLHELAEDEASFTKEDMQLGKHQEFEQKLIDRMIQQENEIQQQASENDSNNTAIETPTVTTTTMTATNTRKNSGTLASTHNSWLSVAKEKTPQENNNIEKKERTSPPPILTSKKPLPTQTLRETAGLLQKNVIRTDAKTALVTTPTPESVSPISVTPPVVSNAGDIISNNEQGTNKNENISISPTLNQCTNEDTEENNVIKDKEYNLLNSKLSETTDLEKQLSIETHNLHISNDIQQNPLNFSSLTRFSDKESFNSKNLYPTNNLTNIEAWNNTPNNPLPDVIPIKSSNDWEAAFGFNSQPELPLNPPLTPTEGSNPPSVSGEDDDLGFDPWFECNKGLAELLEKESNAKHNNTWPTQPIHQQTNNYSPNKNDFHRINRFGIKVPNMNDFPPSAIPPQHTYKMPSMHPNNITSPTRRGLSEWQNGLRALLPSVNINFAMDSNNQTKSPQNLQNFNLQNGIGIREKPRFQLGYDQWGFNSTNSSQNNQNQSSLFPTNSSQNQSSFFHSNFGVARTNNDRFGSIAPPPGLLSSQQFPNDPAIIAGGSKPPPNLPTSFRAPQHPLEDTPHWMKSLQTLTDTDSFNKPGQGNFLSPKKDNQIPATTFSGWPNLGSRDQMNHQPPPGFQSRLPYTNSTEFGIRQSLLENQS